MRIYFLFLLSFSISIAQEVKIPLTITDNDGGAITLYFGLDPKATDGIDPSLGESPLPPLPPTGSFDARFILPGSTDDSQEDYRNGNKTSFIGNITYEIQFQAGNGKSIYINWNLPTSVTGNLQDQFGGIIVNKSMTGAGNTTITNLAINKLNMVIQYHFIPSDVNEIKFKANEIPAKYELNQNYPNPFNPNTIINFSIPITGFVTIKVYDLLGRYVATILNENKPVGNYKVEFNGGKLNSGIYFYRMESESFSQTKKLLLLK